MNIPTSFDDFDRGQVGIGTLIIFIALVLVAAVAAGVLVNTAGDLQSRASNTGEDAQASVSNQIEIVSATGIDTSDNNEIDSLELVVKKSAGSDPIDLSEATIQYNSGTAAETLTYAGSGNSASSTSFDTAGLDGSEVTRLSTVDQRIKITIDADAIEGDVDLSEGSQVDLTLTDQSGASTVYGVNVPSVVRQTYVEV